jgi:hypothetical protein
MFWPVSSLFQRIFSSTVIPEPKIANRQRGFWTRCPGVSAVDSLAQLNRKWFFQLIPRYSSLFQHIFSETARIARMHSNPKADEAELALSWAAERRRRGKFAASHVQRQPSLGQIQANRAKSWQIVFGLLGAAVAVAHRLTLPRRFIRTLQINDLQGLKQSNAVKKWRAGHCSETWRTRSGSRLDASKSDLDESAAIKPNQTNWIRSSHREPEHRSPFEMRI